jgi:lambda family phage portal protein
MNDTEKQLQERQLRALRLQMKRLYEGAKFDRLTADWLAGGTSADAEIRSSMARLRNRARQVIRDSDHAKAAKRMIVNNVIGTGVRMQAQLLMARSRDGKPRLDKTKNATIERKFAAWCAAEVCHTGGTLAFQDIEEQVVGAPAESGEVFVRLVPEAFGGGRIPLALELIEADQLDETVDGYASVPGQMVPGGEWRLGVHVNEWGRPIEYAFLTRHPGDVRGGGPMAGQRVIVPAEQIIHCFIPERPGQTRGVTWFASALKQLHHLVGYQEAEVVRARAASQLMGFIVTDSGAGEELGEEVVDGEHVTTFEAGVYKTLFAGQRVEVPDLKAPNGQFEPFVRVMLRAMAAGLGVSYESISRDFSQTNYSSSRLALLEDRENWRALQQRTIRTFHQRVFRAWLRAAVSVGEVSLPGYQQEPERYETAIRWVARGWEWVDPEKEGKAYRDAVRDGFMTQAEVVMSRGADYHELIEQRAAELEEQERLGLVFDTNPSKVDQRGADNTPPAPEPPPAEDPPPDPPSDPPPAE